ncbi:MAG: hypothetical protein ABIO63_02115 [Casimicrobiaceae bacterium]
MRRLLIAIALALASPVSAQTVTVTGPITCAAGKCMVPLAVKPDTVRLRDTLYLPSTVPVVLRPDFTSICAGFTCTFDASTSTGVKLSYAWDLGKFPDRYAAGKIVSGTYPHEGPRDVVLTITDSLGKTASVGKTITIIAPVVTPPPPPPVTPPPPPVVVGTLPAHPRVWMNPARVTKLRAQVTANTVRWQRVKSAADGQLARSDATSSDLDKLPDLCLAYLGTSDARYAARAGVILTWYAVEASDLKGDSGYGYRFNLPLVTMGLDWCFDGLTVAQRQQTATWLMNRADWVWPETNPTRVGGWAVTDATNNYWWGFMMTGPAALAAEGVDGRAPAHIALATQKWSTQAQAFFAGEGVGGASAEGTNYESFWRIGSFADAFQTAGIAMPAPWLQDALRWKLHSTMPGGQFKAALGDQPRTSDASFFTYDRMHGLYALSAAGADSTLTGQAYAWLNLIGQVATSEFNATATLADELRMFDPAQPVGTLATLPKSYYSAGAGYFITRQSWTDPNATVLVFESGPVNTGGHGARNANGFMLWKGGWISATANIYSASGIETQTQHYNNVTVGAFGGSPSTGPGQYLKGGNTGTILSTQITDQLVAVRAQAKDTYGYQDQWTNARFVSDYLRTVAYLPVEDVVIVVDRVTAIDSTRQKVWRWQSRNPPVIAGNTFTLSNPTGSQRCVGTVLTPATLGTQAIALGNTPGVATSHAVTVTTPLRPSDVMVTVLQCSAQSTVSATISATGAVVRIGSKQVTVPFDGSVVVAP